MSRIRTDRLLKLADFLETVPASAFDISAWQAAIPSKPEGEKPGECGFAGCAMGWAAHEKMFPGLDFIANESFGRTWYELQYRDEAGRVSESFYAAAAAMGISYDEACHLFDPDFYAQEDDDGCKIPVSVPPESVAERIRRFVRDNSVDDTAGSVDPQRSL